MTDEKALEILEMFLHKDCSLARTEFAYDANTIWHAVKKAKNSLEVNRWIPCSERLPSKFEEVFVYVYHNTRPCIAWIDDRGWQTEGFACNNNEPIAWIPLPKPYGVR